MSGFTYFALQLGSGILLDSRIKREKLIMGISGEHKELDALIRLIDDPSESIYRTIYDRICAYGAVAIPLLEEAWEKSFDPVIQKRIENLVHNIHLDDLKMELKSWSQFHNEDLLRGFMLVTKYQYQDLDQEMLIKTIGQITQDVWLELNNNLTGLEKVKVINHVLFDIHKFTGNVSNLESPDNYYLNNLLDSHKGCPLSLGILYIVIARSLKIPVYGVDLPRHFVLAYQDEIMEERQQVTADDVLFYLNPMNKGAVFTKNEIALFVKQLDLEKKDEYFRPCDNRIIIRRMIKELIHVYNKSGNKVKSEELAGFLDVID